MKGKIVEKRYIVRRSMIIFAAICCALLAAVLAYAFGMSEMAYASDQDSATVLELDSSSGSDQGDGGAVVLEPPKEAEPAAGEDDLAAGTDIAIYSSVGQLRVSVPVRVSLGLSPWGGNILTPSPRTSDEPSVPAGTADGNAMRRGNGYGIENLSSFNVRVADITFDNANDRFNFISRDFSFDSTTEGYISDLALYLRLFPDEKNMDEKTLNVLHHYWPPEKVHECDMTGIPSNWGRCFNAGAGTGHYPDIFCRPGNYGYLVTGTYGKTGLFVIPAAKSTEDGIRPGTLGLAFVGYNSRLVEAISDDPVKANDLFTVTYKIVVAE